MADRELEIVARIARGVSDLPAETWDSLAPAGDPFISHKFLSLLERSGSVGEGSGWTPIPVMVERAGRITAAELVFHSNGGAFADLSTAVMERTMLHADNAYYLPNVNIRGRACRTNLPPNTAFRGFGAPQAMAAIENVMQEVAIRVGRDALDVRLANVYSDDPSSGRCNAPDDAGSSHWRSSSARTTGP